MKRALLRHACAALVAIAVFAGQETWALAGVTGGLTGTVIDAGTSAPVAGARVTAASPSQEATTVTDASGHFTFLTLAPDSYTVSVTKDQYQATSAPGQIVFADTVQTLTLRLQKSLVVIGHVSATAGGSLVKSGTTADVYSVNAATQNAVQALGGGGSLNSAYSAVASVPGAYVPNNQTGYFQTVMIRGGDYDQVGYEFDGVPVNRSFDNYPSGSASSLGNAEVQVYTGAPPANSEGAGLSGYINQVIKTGTFPGFMDGYMGIGTPAYYHRAAVEVAGATPDRLFSYYVGVAGYNQDLLLVNTDNAANYNDFLGTPMSFTGDVSYAPDPNGVVAGLCPGNASSTACYYYVGATNYSGPAWVNARDVVTNLHFAIPHHSNSGRDDIQLLWDSESLHNGFYSSTNDIVATQGCGAVTNGAACANAIHLGAPLFLGGYQWNCQSLVGSTFSVAAMNAAGKQCTGNYSFPNTNAAPFSQIPGAYTDTTWNNQEIVKLQYTHNMGSTAFLRLYGYTYFSDWLQNGPQGAYADFAGCCAADYELTSHTRGASANLQDQFNVQNLVSLQASYVTANSIRDNNTQMFNFTGERSFAAVAVNAADPYSGLCYNNTGATTCAVSAGGTPQGATFATWANLQSGAAPALPGSCPDPKVTSKACTYLLAENSLYATYNQIIPKFFSSSLTDEFRPTDKWLFNIGGRLDSFTFDGADTDTGAARNFWTNAFNLDTCVNNVTGATIDKITGLGLKSPNDACPSGYIGAFWQNQPANYTYNIWQPRIAGTYTAAPESVLRFSFGRYPQAPNSAYEQYNTLQENLAAYDAANFYQFGRTTPGYPIEPATSLNYDISWEQRIRNTDLSFKVTPFLRQTQNQIQNFFLDQKTGFISGLNVGSQRSQGVEVSMQKGDFARNGWAGQLSFTYTDSYITYGTLQSGLYGTSVIAGTNDAIAAYNAYTSACAPGGAWVGKIGPNHVPYCGATATGVAAAPCYTPYNPVNNTGGQPVYKCTSADVGNPYWNSPQNLIDPNAEFPTYSIFPGGVGSSAAASGVPYVATFILGYKNNKWSVNPSLQFSGGGRYGYPQTMPGIDPASCSGILPVAGSNGASRYNALDCTNTLAAIPDTYTGTFDGLGAFLQPNNLAMNLQLSYAMTPRVSVTGVLANLFNTCWGGSVEAWTSTDHNVCSYIAGGFEGEIMPVGNTYNPAGFNGSIVQPFRKYPYTPTLGPFNQNTSSAKGPFQFYVTTQIKL